MMNKFLTLLAILILFGCESSKENEKDPFVELTKLIDQYAESTLGKGNINALALAIYKDGEVYQNFFGDAGINGNNIPKDSLLYEIASISKVFVGSLAAKAVLENKITLEDDIRMYLGRDFPNLEFEGTPISIKNLLTHTLGFEPPEQINKVYKDTTIAHFENKDFTHKMDFFLEELKTVKLDKTPGTHYDYNNIGPELMAYILEQVYKKPYADLLQIFLDDLGMKNTYLQEKNKHKEFLSHSYDKDNKLAPLDENPLLGGASGIITSLSDLTKFMKFQLEGNASFIEESSRFLFRDGEDDTGYFWDLGIGKKEGFYYSKTGTAKGFQSAVLVCPDSDYGLILIMNNTSESAFNDWASLYNRIEYDLIEYPKINAWSLVENEFVNSPKEASEKYSQLKRDSSKYFATSNYLNTIGYSFLHDKQIQKAIEIFKLALSEDQGNANLYDSLGEAYFNAKEYGKSKENYLKSIALNPNNKNAEKYITEINELLLDK